MMSRASSPPDSTRALDVALDVGATSVKAIAVDASGAVVARACHPVGAGQADAVGAALAELENVIAMSEGTRLAAVCGAGASHWAELLGARPVQDLAAVCRGAVALVPAAGAVLEIGGERARFLRLQVGPDGRSRVLRDHRQNSVCSAGTGAFLEQEARRLGLTPAQLGRLAAAAGSAPRIAGRCAVFARTDIVHQMQNGVPVAAIAAGLCHALVQAIRSELIGIRPWDAPLVLVGGVAASPGIAAALREELSLSEAALIMPAGGEYAAVLGASILARERRFAGGLSLVEAVHRARLGGPREGAGRPAGPPLVKRAAPADSAGASAATVPPRAPATRALLGSATAPLFLGLDVGSTSTNLAILDGKGEVLTADSVPTRGRPLEAVGTLLRRQRLTFPGGAPRAVGVTGSARAFTAGLCGADLIVNEVTAHAAAASAFWPGVETVLDIGGQDAKFISLRDGRVCDFALNKACAAGTGAFLEEMAAQLGLDVRADFASEAFRSRHPADLGERCAVFVASELRRRQREGAAREDLAAGLAYSIARNYLARVVCRRAIGDVICMQGGVAGNAAVVAALEALLGRPVLVHSCHEAAGAFGAALLAGERCRGSTQFRGFAWLDDPPPRVEAFRCEKCENLCVIHHTRDEGGRTFRSGGLCDRHDGGAVSNTPGPVGIEDLFAERQALLEKGAAAAASGTAKGALGLPRALTVHELLPFWSAFLDELGVRWVVSPTTSRRIIREGVARSLTSTCLPLRVAYGHCTHLQEAQVARILAPSIGNLAFGTREERLSHACSAVQAWPFTARALCGDTVPWLTPTLRFALPRLLRGDAERLGRDLGADARRSRRALAAGLAAQAGFTAALATRGHEIAMDFAGGTLHLIILSRPYTICEPQAGLPLRRICRDLGVVPVPADCFPGKSCSVADLDGMYWYYGRRLLQTVRALRDRNSVAFVFLSNFGCGVDSFLGHFLRAETPPGRLLELELDQHGEFTGIRTRVEAFVDTLRHAPAARSLSPLSPNSPRPGEPSPPTAPAGAPPPRQALLPSGLNGRELLLPNMSDHAHALAASFRACGVAARVLPAPDSASIRIGQLAMSGPECLPCAFLAGDMLRALAAHDSSRPSPAFYMVSGDGPCRLGQYPYLLRRVLDAAGGDAACILDTGQDEAFYEKLGAISAGFQLTAWRGIVATDLLHARWRRRRPYAVDRSAIDGSYHAGLRSIAAAIESRRPVTAVLRSACAELDAIPLGPGPHRLVVAVLGENYVRCNPVANAGVADRLEALGVETWFPALGEWIHYTNWTAVLHCGYEGRRAQGLKLRLTDALLRREARRLAAACGRGTAWCPPAAATLRRAAPYLPRTFEGEATLASGKTLECHARGCAGVVHVVPFGCIVGTIYETMSCRLSEDLGGFPILTVQFDGVAPPELDGQLEAFLMRVAAWRDHGQG
jgi:predicted CoA-substrate-specific enzyme activase